MEALREDELRAVLGKLESQKNKEAFGLVWASLAEHWEKEAFCSSWTPHALEDGGSIHSPPLITWISLSVCFSLFYPGVTDSDLCHRYFLHLCSLNLQNCKGALSRNCHNLEELGLQGCTNITDSGLAVLVDGCQRMKYLDINKYSNVGDNGIFSISKACSASLKTLKLLDCYKLGDAAILSLAKFCKNLEILIIGGCRDISDESIKSLAAACNVNLKILRMDWCLNVSDSSLNCILSHCRSLEVLDVGCCEEVTDAAFQGLGSETENFELTLKILKVSNCPKITVAGISMILELCKTLEYIDVRSCPHVTKAGCDEAGLQFPTCCKVNFAGSLAEPDVLI